MVTMPGDWQQHAACRDYPAPWWHADRGPEQTRALTICRGCPVQSPCLEYALRLEAPTYRYGIWGGTLPVHRATLAGTPHTVRRGIGR